MTLLEEAVGLTKAAARPGAPAKLRAAIASGQRDPRPAFGCVARGEALQGGLVGQ
jgi:hypothetical protein